MTGYIYFIIDLGKVIYIGKSFNPSSRIQYHLSGKFTFDDVRLIPCDALKMDHYERRWIARFKPRMNNHFNPDKRSEMQFFRIRRKRDKKSIKDFPALNKPMRVGVNCFPCRFKFKKIHSVIKQKQPA